MANLSLEEMVSFLKKDELDCFIQEPGEGYPNYRLLLYFGTDDKNRERILEVTIKDQFLTEKPMSDLTDEGDPKYCAVEFYVKLPFMLRDHSVAETARFIAFINRSCDFPGFEMDEVDATINFRYILFEDKMHWSPEPIKGIIGAIMMYLELFSVDLEKVAMGAITTPELLERYLETIYVRK